MDTLWYALIGIAIGVIAGIGFVKATMPRKRPSRPTPLQEADEFLDQIKRDVRRFTRWR